MDNITCPDCRGSIDFNCMRCGNSGYLEYDSLDKILKDDEFVKHQDGEPHIVREIKKERF